MGVEKRKKHVGEVVAAGGVEHGAGVATDGTSAFQVGYESESDKYDVTPLTVEQRKELGIEQYYRPFRVNKQETVTSRSVYWAGKRVFDIVCAGLALVVLSPILAVALLAIYIEDPKASPIFKQERVGMDGKIFHMLKCRSMVANAEELLSELLKDNQAQDKAFKIKDDPRITKVGKFIRNTSIDELPQLVNILKGEMSIVGPRPPLQREVELYDEYEKQRLMVTPGLTCFWQVYPRRHEIDFDDWVALDVKYVQERSWWVDLKLIFRTVGTVLKGGAD